MSTAAHHHKPPPSANAPALLALSGLCGAGKSTVARLIETRFGIQCIYFGALTFQELKQHKLTVNPQTETVATAELRARLGMDAYAKLLLPTIRQHIAKQPLSCIDSLYSEEEYLSLKAALPHVTIQLVEVKAPQHLRYQRLSARKHRPFTAEQSAARDRYELNTLHKAALLQRTTASLSNAGSLETLKMALIKLLTQLDLLPPPGQPA